MFSSRSGCSKNNRPRQRAEDTGPPPPPACCVERWHIWWSLRQPNPCRTLEPVKGQGVSLHLESSHYGWLEVKMSPERTTQKGTAAHDSCSLQDGFFKEWMTSAFLMATCLQTWTAAISVSDLKAFFKNSKEPGLSCTLSWVVKRHAERLWGRERLQQCSQACGPDTARWGHRLCCGFRWVNVKSRASQCGWRVKYFSRVFGSY